MQMRTRRYILNFLCCFLRTELNMAGKRFKPTKFNFKILQLSLPKAVATHIAFNTLPVSNIFITDTHLGKPS